MQANGTSFIILSMLSQSLANCRQFVAQECEHGKDWAQVAVVTRLDMSMQVSNTRRLEDNCF